MRQALGLQLWKLHFLRQNRAEETAHFQRERRCPLTDLPMLYAAQIIFTSRSPLPNVARVRLRRCEDAACGIHMND